MISWLFIEFLGHIATWSTTNDDGSEIAATILETKILIKILPSLLDNMTTNLSSCSVILLSKTWESVIVLLSCAHGPNCCLSFTEKRKDVRGPFSDRSEKRLSTEKAELETGSYSHRA